MLASLGIVHIHVTSEPTFFRTSLAIFLITVMALGVKNDTLPPFRSYVTRRLVRLGIPFLFWSIAYLPVVGYLQAVGSGFEYPPSPWLTGPMPHLWFLPYVLVASVLLYPVQLGLNGMARGRALGLCFFVAAASVGLVRDSIPNYRFPKDAWLFAIPSLFLALAFGRLLGMAPERRAVVAKRIFVIGLAIGLPLHFYEPSFVSARYALASSFLGATIAWPGRPDRFTTAITSLRYGVYCVHPLITLVCISEPGSPKNGWLTTFLVYGLSIVVIVPLRRTFLRSTC